MQHWDNMLMPVAGPDGRPAAILCVSREVTAARQAEESLRTSQERLAIALQVGGMGVWDYDIVHDTLECDEQWYRIMGRDPADPVRSVGEFQPFIHPDDRGRATEVVQTAAQLIASDDDYAIVFRIVRPDGELRWVRSSAHVEHVGDVPIRAVGFVIDITDARRGELALRDANRALEQERTALARQSLEDPLTGIANRRGLDAELARVCAGMHNRDQSVCVVMIDVDYFKGYNDRYGHVAGDDALREIARVLRAVVRRADVVARYGGEEFVFVLTDTTDPTPVLERLRAAVHELGIVHDGSPVGRLTISCGGVTVAGGSRLDPAHLLGHSDRALYEAKAAGRDRYVVHATDG